MPSRAHSEGIFNTDAQFLYSYSVKPLDVASIIASLSMFELHENQRRLLCSVALEYDDELEVYVKKKFGENGIRHWCQVFTKINIEIYYIDLYR